MALNHNLLKLLRQTALVGLVLFSLIVSYHTARTAAFSWDPQQPFDNPVDKWEKRIQRVRSHIPGDVTTLGYVADWDLPGVQYDIIDQDAEYMLTQYALAPLRVIPGLDQEWIIGNFTHAGFEAWLDEQIPSYEIVDLKQGIYLIHRSLP